MSAPASQWTTATIDAVSGTGAGVGSPDAAADGRARAVIDAVLPSVDGGRYPVKRVIGEPLDVTVHAFTDGHDLIRVLLCWRPEEATRMEAVEMQAVGNDVWTARFTPHQQGRYRYTAVAWVDHFASWRQELRRRVDPADIRLAAQAGASLADEAAERADPPDRTALLAWSKALRAQAQDGSVDIDALQSHALDDQIAAVVARHPDLSLQTRHAQELPLAVDRTRAAFGAWYEMFPRSAALEADRHGTLRDVQARLPYVAELGFDVLYLPPIHPIGRVKRKGRNNALVALAGDVGSPWAIGAAEGGHTAIHPELGTAEDFRALVKHAGSLGIEIALDIAFQCAPDHPWVKEHPQWFRWRPDGSVQFAENPPKKYQDIYPFNFETEDWPAMWQALKGIFDHWIGQGVNIFRVDNPHTKAFPFWEWAIAEIKRESPQVLFLAEAFTRPKVMHRLAKVGFSQSYTYFTWRNSAAELREYFTELAEGPGRDYFRPNVWPNTPDILNDHLHGAPRSVFTTRFLLAATLSGNYGIYGPAYELMERTPREPGSEEYRDSEKYEVRHWDLERSDSLKGLIALVNRARHDHAALRVGSSLRFLGTDNDRLLAYARRSLDGLNLILVVVNLDPHNRQSGWTHVDARWLGLGEGAEFTVSDLLTGHDYLWRDGANFVMLDPADMPAHLFSIRLPADFAASRSAALPAVRA